MTNKDIWQSILSIIHQGFTPNGISKLEEYAENFISQQLVYKRFSPSEQHGCIEGGTNHVIASLLAGAEIEPNKLSAPEGSFKREQQCGETQAERINVIRSLKGNVFVIDCDIRINTPELRIGGTQLLTNDIEWQT